MPSFLRKNVNRSGTRRVIAVKPQPGRREVAQLFLLAAAILGTSDLRAAEPFTGAETFVQKNCATCHNSPKGAGRLDLTRLAYEPANPDNFSVWIKIHDRVSAGEMPPAGMPRPGGDSIAQFVRS